MSGLAYLRTCPSSTLIVKLYIIFIGQHTVTKVSLESKIHSPSVCEINDDERKTENIRISLYIKILGSEE